MRLGPGHIIVELEKRIPGLIEQNVEQLTSETTFSRHELYNLYTQFKAMCSLALERNPDKPTIYIEAVDKETFILSLTQLLYENPQLGERIFSFGNQSLTGYLSWKEFLESMRMIASSNLFHKIDIFFKILDEDGNGLFSYKEIFEVALLSLARYNDAKGEKFMTKMSHYLTKKIFSMMKAFFATKAFSVS